MNERITLPRWSHFFIAVILSVLVLWIRSSANSILGDQGPFFLSALAVLISAYVGGLWPGLFATLLTTAGGIFYFLGPSTNFQFDTLKTKIIIASQLTVSLCISLVCGALRASEIETDRAAKEKEVALDRLNNLFQSITDALIILSKDYRAVLVNEAAIELWQIPRGFQDIPFRDIVPPEVFDALSVPLEHSITNNKPIFMEVPVRSLNRTFEIRGFPGSEGLMVYFHDITDRLATNEALSKLAIEQERINAFLDSLLRHAPIGYAFFDREHRIERVNGPFAQMNGLSEEQHLGRTIRDIHPDQAEQMERVIDEVFATGEAVENMEFSTRHSDGQEHYLLSSLYPVKSISGEVSAVGAVLFDVTPQKEAELTLRESEDRFRTVADGAPMMIWVCDPTGAGTWFNKPWLEFRGVSLPQAISDGCFAGILPDDRVWVEEKFNRAIQEVRPFEIEFRTLDHESRTRWLLLQGTPSIDANGNVRAFLMASVDVTDRKSIEQSLQMSLANERAARSDAENANRLKDEFLASLSHELRTPLTTILGWTELLRNKQIREKELDDGLDVIHRSSKLQIQLINDLLDMSRINIGKITLEPQFVDLYELVDDTIQLLSASAAEKEIRIDPPALGDPLLVRVDPDKITQVLWNLLTNSIKFTPAGGSIQLTLGEEGDMAVLQVRDNGIGIDADFLPHIFDRFRQADGTRTRSHGGLGLGLAISKQLAELHGGTLAAESAGLNSGSIFTLRLPLTSLPGELPSNNEPRQEATMGARLEGVRIQVVEDDEPTRSLVAKWLEMEGAIVTQAESASQARKLLAENPSQVLLSDIGMPEEDGYQLIRSIRGSDGEFRRIPAVAVTAFASDEDRARAYEAGFQLFVTKPVDQETLVKVAKEALSLSTGQTTPGSGVKP